MLTKITNSMRPLGKPNKLKKNVRKNASLLPNVMRYLKKDFNKNLQKIKIINKTLLLYI